MEGMNILWKQGRIIVVEAWSKCSISAAFNLVLCGGDNAAAANCTAYAE
jgi:hypothetical protein